MSIPGYGLPGSGLGWEIISDDVACVRLLTEAGVIHEMQKSLLPGYNQAAAIFATDTHFCMGVYHHDRHAAATDNGFVVIRLARAHWTARQAAAFFCAAAHESRVPGAPVVSEELERSNAVNG